MKRVVGKARHRAWVPLITAMCGLWCFAASAKAQTSASLLVKPWEADQTHEDTTAGYLFNAGHTVVSRNTFPMWMFESVGRVRLLPGHEASPRFGYDVMFINSNTNQPHFPHQLLDASIAGGTFLSETNGWVTGITLGAGYAGDTPFDRGRAWYGHCDFVLAKKFDEQNALGIGLDYDGHRTYLPDFPLPGFGFSHRFDPTLLLVIGAPVTSVTWEPIPRLRIHADYEVLTDLNADVGYEFLPHLSAFAAMETRDNAFYISELPGHHRLLFSQRRVELGIRWQPQRFIDLSIAGGYAFGTEFRNGWDFRNSVRYSHPSDEPFIRAGLNLHF